MKDIDKTKEELIKELSELRNRITMLESTSLNKIDNQLVINDERWQFALESSSQGVWDWDLRTNKVFRSKEWKFILGFEEDEAFNSIDDWKELIHPDDSQMIFDKLDKFLKGEFTIFNYEYRMRCKDGSYKWILDRGKIIEWNEDGNPLRLIGTHNDITERKELENELREAKEQYEALVSELPAYVLIYKNNRIVYLNDSGIRKINYSKEEIYGKGILDFVVDKDRDFIANNIKKRIKCDDLKDFEIGIMIKPGETFFALVNAKEISYKNEKAVLAIITDISDRKITEENLRNSEEKYRLIAENINDIIWTMDLNFNSTFVSPSVFKLQGYTVEERVKLPLDKLLTPSSYRVAKLKLIEIINALTQGKSFDQNFSLKLELEHIRKDHSTFWAEVNIGLLSDTEGKIIGIHGTTRDISERKQVEIELRKSEKKLQELNGTKDKFFSIIAHDLINPFNTILHYTKLLYDKFDYFNDSDKKEMINDISKSSQAAHSLLENLLTWSRSQRGQMNFDPETIDIKELVNNTISLLKPHANQKEINLHSSINTENKVVADLNMINTVIRNLISNAIKFTNHLGEIKISSKNIYEENKQYLMITISDNGVGISGEDLERLFKIDSSQTTIGTSNEKGTGLGLILCKEFIDKHNCRIWVESELGKGSNFCFTLPKF